MVQAMDGTPAGLAHPALVRMWVKKRKARFVKVRPGVARLTCPHAEAGFRRKWGAVHTVILGNDPGDSAGTALVIDHKVVWSTEAALRGALIVKRLAQRSAARSTRRCRRKRSKGRAAKEARWRHRARPAGWLAPSARHRVHGCLHWGLMLLAYAGAGGAHVTVHVESTPFDTHKVLHPDVEGESCQRGPLYKTNLKGFVMARDQRTCVYCRAKTKLTLDHVVARSRGGGNRHTNIVCACAPCNDDKNNQDVETWLTATGRDQVRTRAPSTLERLRRIGAGSVDLRGMALANVVAPAVGDAYERKGYTVVRSSGADTAAWRAMHGVEKSHSADAACTGAQDTPVAWRCTQPLAITMTGRGRRLVIKRNAAGFPRLTKTGIVKGHRARPAHGRRAGDVVIINGRGKRTALATLTTARHDGRCVAMLKDTTKVHVMAHQTTLVHRTMGANISFPRTGA